MRTFRTVSVAVALVSAAVQAEGGANGVTRNPARVKEIAAYLDETARIPFPMVSDRAEWTRFGRLPGWNAIRELAEWAMNSKVPELTEDLYLDFSRTGDRNRFEAPYFRRINVLQALVAAELVEDAGRFRPAIARYLRAILAERSWVLPAHDRELLTWNGKQRAIDLFSSARGWGIALIVRLLGDRLDPELSARARARVEERVIEPYLAMARAPSANGVSWAFGRYNWNRVCHAGCCLTTLLLRDGQDDRATAIEFAERALPAYLSGICSDGYCSEGMGYWNYGFGNHVLLACGVSAATKGRVDFLADPKNRLSAAYTVGFQLDATGLVPTFADGGGEPNRQLQSICARRWPDALPTSPVLLEIPRQGTHWPHLAFLCELVFGEGADRVAPAKAFPLPIRNWFAEAGVLLCRIPESDFAVGIKVKNDTRAHAHQDCGSYVVADGGRIFTGDPGCERYTARTFSSRRFESKVLNAVGHPVPIADGAMQLVDESRKSIVLSTSFTDARDEIAVDMTKAYPKAERLERLVRTYVFDRVAKSLTVTDEVSFRKPAAFEVSLIAKSPELIEGRYVVTAEGGDWKLVPEDVENYGEVALRRLAVRFTEPVRRARVTVTIR